MEEKVKKIIIDAIEELNEQLEVNQKIEYKEDLKLVGSKSVLDSISFVTLVAIIEDLISERFDQNIVIVNDKAFSQERSPFYSVTTLSNYIVDLIKEES